MEVVRSRENRKNLPPPRNIVSDFDLDFGFDFGFMVLEKHASTTEQFHHFIGKINNRL